MSLRFPGVSRTRSGFPSPSTTAWTFVLNPPRLRPNASLPPFLRRCHAGGPWWWCCPASGCSHPQCPGQSALQKHAPKHLAGFTGETGCTHFSKGHTAPAGPSKVFLYSANTGFHWALPDCLFRVFRHAPAFLAAAALLLYSIVLLSIHVASYFYFTAASLFCPAFVWRHPLESVWKLRYCV